MYCTIIFTDDVRVDEEVTQQQIDRRVTALEDNFGRVLNEMKELVTSINNLSNNFAVYAEKHEHTNESIKRLAERQEKADDKINQNSLMIADYSSAINSFRAINGRVWAGLITGIFSLIGASAAVGMLIMGGS